MDDVALASIGGCLPADGSGIVLGPNEKFDVAPGVFDFTPVSLLSENGLALCAGDVPEFVSELWEICSLLPVFALGWPVWKLNGAVVAPNGEKDDDAAGLTVD